MTELRRTPVPGPAEQSILVVSGDDEERRRLAATFEANGFHVRQAGDTVEADLLIGSVDIDLVIFDAPPLNGDPLDFCRRTYVEGRPPIIMLSESAGLIEAVVVLEVGADDLLPKPVDERLLLAKARALLRRCQRRHGGTAASVPSPDGGWRLYPALRKAVGPRGRSVILSPGDVRILDLFMNNPGVVFTQDSAARALGDDGWQATLFRTAVSRLRRKLTSMGDSDPIRTVRGAGYVYGSEGESFDRASLAPPTVAAIEPERHRFG